MSLVVKIGYPNTKVLTTTLEFNIATRLLNKQLQKNGIEKLEFQIRAFLMNPSIGKLPL